MTKVRVVVRVRPFLPHEVQAIDGNPISCASVLDQECISCEEVVIHLKDPETRRNECYTLDSFYGQEDDIVSQIFCREVSPLIPGIFNGYNATVFAYGATGSGKTYTMQGTNELPGLMPLAMSTVLSLCPSTGSTAEISYYEVYMDKCYDLLELKAKEIMVLDDKDGQIHLRGLSRVPVSSMSEFYQVFNCGIQRRRIAHTGLNDVSSRSHRVLVIGVSSPCDGGSGVVAGKLNLIDLAGNEDNRRTCNEGIRLQESAKINQSLLALSNVIYALNNNKPRVPYRESKLTRILQDSLGGRSRALMVACLSPGEYQQSVYTVSLAARSRQVSNFVSSAKKQETPKVKVDMEALLQSWLESKGKTKSVRRFGAFSSSPFCSKTPGSVSSAKAKPTNGLASNAKEGHVSRLHRNLFNNEGLEDSWMEDTYYQEIEDSKDCFGSTKDCSCTISEECVCLTNISVAVSDENSSNHPDLAAEDAAEDNKGEQTKAAADGVVLESQTYLLDELSDEKEKTKTTESANFTGSPLTSHPDLAAEDAAEDNKGEQTKAAADGVVLESQTYLLDELSDEKEKTKTTESANFTGSPLTSVSIKAVQNSPRNALESQHYSLYNLGVPLQHPDLAAEDAAEDNKGEQTKAAADGVVLESQTYLLDELSDEEEKTKIMESANFTGSPLSSVSIKAARNSPRNALSPINPNVDRNYLENHLSGGQNCSIHFEPKTPKTPHENKLQTIGEYQTTPLDKFNAHSSNLKSSLVQEYLDFLNTASREELLALKGIGQKRAEYILEVRETSPLQSLSDLEKLGLSSKQVHNLFSRAARGIFG